MSITNSGTYHLTGTLENGSISVNVGDDDIVKLVLDNVTITNLNGPAINVENAKKVIIILEEGSTNKLVDGETYDVLDEDINACIYSKDNLIINGSGTLEVTANFEDGIVSKDNIKIIGSNVKVNSKDDAIKGKDYVLVKDANIEITSKGDGIKSTNDTEEDKGYIVIENSKTNITADIDGIQAQTNIKINGGTFEIKANDDAIHADGMIEINDGDFNITAIEGIEATYVKINGGNIKISASDDGINAGNKSDAYTVTIEINGGNIEINMGAGDTDGIDSNGNLYINGGTININANSPFDYDGEVKLSGGKLIVNGEETTTITNQFMGGGMQQGGMQRMR